jgi:hypothetical protein
MLLAFALRLPDFSNWKENPVGLALYGLVLVGGALLGGILLGLVGRYTALLFWKELSTRAVLILRLIGGIGGAALTFSLIGSGDGFGPGPAAGVEVAKTTGPSRSAVKRTVLLVRIRSNPLRRLQEVCGYSSSDQKRRHRMKSRTGSSESRAKKRHGP